MFPDEGIRTRSRSEIFFPPKFVPRRTQRVLTNDQSLVETDHRVLVGVDLGIA